MTTGIKRGFLKNDKTISSRREVLVEDIAAPENLLRSQAKKPVVSSKHHDTTRVYSENPRIVCADYRYPNAPHFLYLPREESEIVFIDYLDSIQKIAQWNVWETPLPSSTEPLPFRIADCPGKGMGMFAQRPIKAGELILSERPIVVTYHGLTALDDQTLANGVFHRAALSGLSREARAAIMSLKNSMGAEIDEVPGILRTNYLQVDLVDEPDEPDAYIGCFPTLSRANHDCSPTANYFFSFRTFSGQFWATRNIAKDQEITIMYTHLMCPRSERQAMLLDKFKFTCTCSICSLPPAKATASDTRRQALARLDAYLDSLTLPPSMSLKCIEEGLGWASDEGMAVTYARLLLLGTTFCVTKNDFITAKQWVKRAKKAYRKVEGEGSYDVKRMEDMQAMLQRVPT